MAETCEHWTQGAGYAQASLYAACPWCELKRLKQELSLAEEGLANYAQEVERLRKLAEKWEAQIQVAFNDYSYGQRCAFEQAARELLEIIGESPGHPRADGA